ncbi:hypothetical protein AVEN_170222-1, partial [Araneus ventricosus]
ETDLRHFLAAVAAFAGLGRHFGLGGGLRGGRRRTSATADERARTPQQDDEDSHQAGDDARQQETPPLSLFKALVMIRHVPGCQVVIDALHFDAQCG